MLFFFELFLFVLVMLTLALGEFVSRGIALVLWLVVTAFALVGYLPARNALRPLLASEGGPSSPSAALPGAGDEAPAPESEPAATDSPTPLDARWARTLLYNWRRANALLLLGLLAVTGWYWLGG
jgi:hypothetical protein